MRRSVLALDAFYLWDSMVTWVVRAQDDLVEHNPLIAGLHHIDGWFYFAFRAGVFLMVNVLLWQLQVEAPSCLDRRWFKGLLAAGIAIYTVPFLMSFQLLA